MGSGREYSPCSQWQRLRRTVRLAEPALGPQPLVAQQAEGHLWATIQMVFEPAALEVLDGDPAFLQLVGDRVAEDSQPVMLVEEVLEAEQHGVAGLREVVVVGGVRVRLGFGKH